MYHYDVSELFTLYLANKLDAVQATLSQQFQQVRHRDRGSAVSLLQEKLKIIHSSLTISQIPDRFLSFRFQLSLAIRLSKSLVQSEGCLIKMALDSLKTLYESLADNKMQAYLDKCAQGFIADQTVVSLMPAEIQAFFLSLRVYYKKITRKSGIFWTSDAFSNKEAQIVLTYLKNILAEFYFNSDKLNAVILNERYVRKTEKALKIELNKFNEQRIIKEDAAELIKLLTSAYSLPREFDLYKATYVRHDTFTYPDYIECISDPFIEAKIHELKQCICNIPQENQGIPTFFFHTFFSRMLFYSYSMRTHPLTKLALLELMHESFLIVARTNESLSAVINRILEEAAGLLIAKRNSTQTHGVLRLHELCVVNPILLEQITDEFLETAAIQSKQFVSSQDGEELLSLYQSFGNNGDVEQASSDMMRHHGIHLNCIPLLNLLPPSVKNPDGTKKDATDCFEEVLYTIKTVFNHYPQIVNFLMNQWHQGSWAFLIQKLIKSDYYLVSKQLPIDLDAMGFVNIIQLSDNRLIMIYEFFLNSISELGEDMPQFKIEKTVNCIIQLEPAGSTMKITRTFHLFPNNGIIQEPFTEKLVLFSDWFIKSIKEGLKNSLNTKSTQFVSVNYTSSFWKRKNSGCEPSGKIEMTPAVSIDLVSK